MTDDHRQEPEPKPRGQRGEGSIYWDAAKGCYVGQISLGYYATGKRRRPKVYGTTRTEVRRKLRQLRKDLEVGTQPSARYTVAEAANDWLLRGLRGRSEQTVAKYSSLVNNHIIPKIGKAKLRDLTADDVDDWLDQLSADLSTSTMRQCLAALRRSIRLAQRRDRVGRNVAELVTDLPRGRRGRPSQALTLDEARAVLAAASGTAIEPYVVLSLMTGIRTEEARALTWNRVHLDREGDAPPHIEVWRSVRDGGDTKTKKSRRSLALPPQAASALRAHQARQAANGIATVGERLVFATRGGLPMDAANVRRAFTRVVRKAGLERKWTPRELRHSFVSLLSADGVPVEEIARLVGHSNTATTELIYRKELRPVITEGATNMSKIFTTPTGTERDP